MSNGVVLEVFGMNKTFPGTKALTDMKFELREGEALALMGENGAGKSTLMNIVSGVLQADSGTIQLMGEEVHFASPREAQDAGIGFVHQELSTCTHLTVAENVFMGRLDKFKNKLGLTDYKELNKVTAEFLARFGSKVKPEQEMRELKMADQQVIEIIKSLVLDCKIIIFDEPTSSLTEKETTTLFKIIEQLKEDKISIIYISHRMEEVFKLCDYITIMRDGHYINTLKISETSFDEVVSSMVGRTISNLYPAKATEVGDLVLEAKNLTRKGVFNDISFQIRKGEILGFSGLVGAGRTEVACSLCGIDPLDSGEVYMEGKKLNIKSYSDAIGEGISYLTEDRKNQGLFLNMSIRQNISVTDLKKITRGIVTDTNLEKQFATDFSQKLNVKIATIEQSIGSLSGGNQQKVMIAKWLYTDPKVFIMDEPTRGIDVGAKSEIHNMLRQLANEGMAVIVISSELPEIIGLCDRVMVLHEGVFQGELNKDELSEERIVTLASGI